MPDMVLFDCDGVLVDSEPVTNAILAENLARHGLALSTQEIDALFVGGTMRAVGEQAVQLGAVLPARWLEDIYADMYARLAEGTPMIAGVTDVLEALDKAGIGYAVGSNGSMEKMRITLGQHPELWDRLRDRLFSAHVHGVAKPDPELYLIAARAYGVAPKRCAVVDDSAAGCRAGVAAGMECFGFAAHDDGARLRTTGARVFHTMRDLPELLGLG
ncbi:MAG: HAD family phosphatase [Paracoccaceae bacterium]